MVPLLPENEVERLARLHAYDILDTPPERGFDRLTRLAVAVFAVPMAAVSLIDADRQWLKSSVGLDEHVECRRRDAFCAHAILHDEVFVVRDTFKDPRFAAHPLVTGAPHIRFYAGAPLRTDDGHRLGTLCLIDHIPRRFTAAQGRMLADLAAAVLDAMTLRQAAARLRAEAAHRQRTQRNLRREHDLLEGLRGTLEERIHERTADFSAANAALRAEITRREQTELALRAAKEEAEKANRAKSEFLSRMSHELRTPLNAILGFGQILKTQVENEDQRDCAGHVVGAGRHLLELVNEVLEIARIEAGQLRLALEPVSLGSSLAEMLDLLRPQAEARGIRFETPRPGSLDDCHVLADGGRLKQVLLNLLSNAVKYGPADSRVVVDCQPEGSGHVRLAVRDFGSGIPADQQARLFVPFERLGAERSGVQGTGLGLALSRYLVEGMHGTIGVQSRVGRGSEFWVRLPRAAGPLAGRLPAAVGLPAWPTDQLLPEEPVLGALACTVLYIEDNASNFRLVERVLGDYPQLRLLSASSGEAGLEIIRRDQPDFILLDVHLPGVTGLEVLGTLRANPRTSGIPVVALSADATRATIERVLDAGGSAYLTKPLNVEHLLHTLSVLRPPEPGPAPLVPSAPALLHPAC